VIASLRGTLVEKQAGGCVVECAGVGYLVSVSSYTLAGLPDRGAPVFLRTRQVVREDAHLLFGFLTHEERTTFRLLVRIAGIGPRTALAILSGLSVAELGQAVAMQESGRLVKVPGIGKKTAERLLLELKGRLGDAVAAPVSVSAGAQADILQALLALGYNDREAAAALKALPADIAVGEGIKLALRALAR